MLRTGLAGAAEASHFCLGEDARIIRSRRLADEMRRFLSVAWTMTDYDGTTQ